MWNYRVVRVRFANEELYYIHEAYYGEDKDNPESITASPVEPMSESVEGLRWVLAKMQEALDKPVIELTEGRNYNARI